MKLGFLSEDDNLEIIPYGGGLWNQWSLQDLINATSELMIKEENFGGLLLLKSSRRVKGHNKVEPLRESHRIEDCIGFITVKESGELVDLSNESGLLATLTEVMESGKWIGVKGGVSTVVNKLVSSRDNSKLKAVYELSDSLISKLELADSYTLNYTPDNFFYDRELMSAKYFNKFKKLPNLIAPVDFNEKILWLILNKYSGNFYQTLVDKYKFKGYVSEKLGSEYTSKVLAVYDHPTEIVFDSLPEKWVMKTTHGSHGVYIHKGGEFDKSKVVDKLSESFNSDYYYSRFGCRESQYRGLVPRVIVEEYVEDLVEYDLLCINGKVKYILAFGTTLTESGGIRLTHQNVYDKEWNLVEAMIGYKNNPNILDPRPSRLDEMIRVTEVLAEGVPLVRVDLMTSGSRVLVGEMTFSPYAGLGSVKPEELRVSLGREIDLSLDPKL